LLIGSVGADAQQLNGIPGDNATSPGDFNGSIPFPDSSKQVRPFVIRTIYITGNRRTKSKIILRELGFKEKEEFLLPELVKKFEDARRQLMNTALFHQVTVALKSFSGYDVDILIDVKERWYLFPLPYFKPVDRNFNQWLVKENASLDRVEYGVKVLHNNATGLNDKFSLWLIDGYTRQVSMFYDRYYIDKRLKWGLKTGLALGENREVNYITQNNKQLFYKDPDNFIRSFFTAYGELSYRKRIKTRHKFGLAFTHEKIDDTITVLNPAYFKNGSKSISFPTLYYSMNYFDVDYIPYPLTGYLASVDFEKRGFSRQMNSWQTTVKAGGNWKLANKMYTGVRLAGSIRFPFRQPYYNQRMLGYRDFFMQGYEYYVMDGAAAFYLRTSLSREIVKFNIRMPVQKSTITSIPFRVYAKTFVNMGYAYNPVPETNNLNNRPLYSWGVGFDIVTFYDFILRIEWSFNHLGENGLYLHKKTYF